MYFKKHSLLAFIAVERLSSNWNFALLILPFITSRHPHSPCELPAPFSKVFHKLSFSSWVPDKALCLASPSGLSLAHEDSLPLWLLDLLEECPAFLQSFALQVCLPRDSINWTPKNSVPYHSRAHGKVEQPQRSGLMRNLFGNMVGVQCFDYESHPFL